MKNAIIITTSTNIKNVKHVIQCKNDIKLSIIVIINIDIYVLNVIMKNQIDKT